MPPFAAAPPVPPFAAATDDPSHPETTATEDPSRPEATAPFTPSRTRTWKVQGYRVEVDPSRQALCLSVPVECDTEEGEPEIFPTLRAARLPSRMVSAAMLAQKAKQFDDGLIAAVELAAQQGAGRLRGKAYLIETWLASLAHGSPAIPAALLLSAARLGGVAKAAPPALAADVARLTHEFLADELRSKPLGIYTWSEPLRRVFQQDRLLQAPLRDPGQIEALARVLREEAAARTTYEGVLALASRLTGALDTPDLTSVLRSLDRGQVEMGRAHAIFPPSRSVEADLAMRLLGDRSIPEGFDLIGELAARIRDGSVDLRPTAASGWHDLQTWALEPLVAPERSPEASRLSFERRYGELLLGLFKGILALTRETHVKQLAVPLAACAEPALRRRPSVVIDVLPELSAEPTVSYFLRRALGYRFVRRTLEGTFGEEALARIERLTPEGPVELPLPEELAQIEGLFFGAAAAVASDLGMSLDEAMDPAFRDACAVVDVLPDRDGSLGSGRGREHDAQAFRRWIARDDRDVGRDARMMVPVFHDLDRQETKAWVFLGWSTQRVLVSFRTPPVARVFAPDGREASPPEVDVRFGALTHDLAYPVMAEIYVDRLLDRDELRALCDEHRTRSAILAALGGCGGRSARRLGAGLEMPRRRA
ncbi:hypothetical protein [Sorangium sp. So ce1182]|uniref:hypothetical protein n=1 Tax=Sorangium sp. So ce1182 TaxID=3133334 RepID=UPI003F5ECA56